MRNARNNKSTADYGALRKEVMATMRQGAHALARDGLSQNEIAARLEPGLTATESELVLHMARSEAARARRARAASLRQRELKRR